MPAVFGGGKGGFGNGVKNGSVPAAECLTKRVGSALTRGVRWKVEGVWWRVEGVRWRVEGGGCKVEGGGWMEGIAVKIGKIVQLGRDDDRKA